MLIAHHLILTGYGHWLPNDPRGSMSHEVFAPELAPLAEVHFGRRRVQPTRAELRAFYVEAQKRLAHPVLWFNDAERQALPQAFGDVVRTQGLTCYAAAVLSNHAHLLIRKHRLTAEDMLHLLKQAGRAKLHEAGLAPPEHPVFSADSCHLYKSDLPSMHACIRYIDGNFTKHKLPRVIYDFVTPYDDWPFRDKRRSSRHERGPGDTTSPPHS